MSLTASTWVAERLDDPACTLSTLARCMAFAIADRVNTHTRTTYTGDWIAQRCGIKPASIRRPLAQLAAAGVFEVEHRPGRSSIVRLPEVAGESGTHTSDAALSVQPDAVRDPADAAPLYPQPRAVQPGVDTVDYPQPRAVQREPRAVQRGPRAVQPGVPGTYQEEIPAAATPSIVAPPDDLVEVSDLAAAAARLELRSALADGTRIRNHSGYQQAIAERLVTDDIERIRTALAHPASTHERAEWLVGARRHLPAC